MKSFCHSVIAGLVTLGVVGVASAIPPLINYQGYLTDDLGNPVTDGDYRLVFRIWDAETGPNQLWSEDHDTVSVANGLFNVILGGISPLQLSFDTDYWVGIQIGVEPELPRIRLTSVGYSYRAHWADTAAWADSAAHSPRDNDWEPDTAGINIYRLTGNVGIGTPTPGRRLEIGGGGQMPTQAGDGVYINPDATQVSVSVEENSGVEGGIMGHASGNVYVGSWSNNPVVLRTDNADRMTLDVAGKIGIRTTSPTSALDVNGAYGYNQLRMRTSYTPVGEFDMNGQVGDIAWDSKFIYIKTAVGWRRAALSAF